MQHVNTHPVLRFVIGNAAVSAIGVIFLLLSSPGKAGAGGSPELLLDRSVSRVVQNDGHGQRIDRTEIVTRTTDCKNGTVRVDSLTQTVVDDGKAERMRVVICNRNGLDHAGIARQLASARQSVARDASLSSVARTKALAALDREIANFTVAPRFSRQ